MPRRVTLLGLSLLLLPMAGCASSGDQGVRRQGTSSSAETSHRSGDSADPLAREAYTTCYEIRNLGTVLGYLVTYDSMPRPNAAERSLPEGSSRIQDRSFVDLGFSTEGGDLYRFDRRNEAEHLGTFPRDEGLRRFFDVQGLVLLVPLRNAVADERAEARR